MKKALSSLTVLVLVLGLALVLAAPVSGSITTDLQILKVDSSNATINAPGATFNITPNPFDFYGTGFLIVVDNHCGADYCDNNTAYGTIKLVDIFGARTYTITEIAAPAGYVPDPNPQSQYIGDQGGTFTFTFVNTPEECKGKIEIKKFDDAAEPQLLKGACFNVTPNPYDGGTLTVCDGDATYDKDATDGVILLENVRCGNYTVTEVTPPAGYVIVTGSQNVTVTNGSTQTVNFINTECKGKIEIKKFDDAAEPQLLKGACFNVTPNPYDGGTLTVCDGDSNDKDASDGVILLENVRCGNYTVTEVTAPAGYVIVTGSQNVTVTNGSTETVDFHNCPCVGEIEILKKDEAGAPLAGACFNVTPNPYNGGTLTVCDDDSNDADKTTTGRILLSNVPPDDYDIVEVQAPPGGYVLDPDVETVTVTCNTIQTAEFTNSKECKGCLKICKYEDNNGNHQRDYGESWLSGWVFNITDSQGNSWLVTTDATGSSGFSAGGVDCCPDCTSCETPCLYLPAGQYNVTEVSPLPDGWTNTDPGDGSLTKTVTVECDKETRVDFGNKRPCFGCLKICKYEDKDGDGQKDNGEPYLSGWTFNVTDSQGNSQLVTTGGNCYSGSVEPGCGCDYCVTICKLAAGEYTVTEVTPLPVGWTNTDPKDGSYQKTVTVECDRTSTVKFGNQGPCTGCLKIYKYNDRNGDGDYDPGRPYYESYLSGWAFTVTDTAGNSWSGTTNYYGYVKICGLAPGEYTVTETAKAGWTNTDPVDGSRTKTVTVSCGTTETVKFGNKKSCIR